MLLFGRCLKMTHWDFVTYLFYFFQVKITTLPFLEFGCGKAMIWPLNCHRTGKSITTPTIGKNWMPTLLRRRRWSTSICAGLVMTCRAKPSTKARSSNKLLLEQIFFADGPANFFKTGRASISMKYNHFESVLYLWHLYLFRRSSPHTIFFLKNPIELAMDKKGNGRAIVTRHLELGWSQF